MKSIVALLASLAVVSAQTYFVQTGYADAVCGTQAGASATLSGPSSSNSGNSFCQSGAGVYFTCAITGPNITYNTVACANDAVVQSQSVANNVCVTSSGQLPGALTPSSKYQCLSTGSAAYASFNPKVETWFAPGCSGPSPIAVTPTVGQCFRQQTSNPYIVLTISGNNLNVGYGCNNTAGVCTNCQSNYQLSISNSECVQSTQYDAVFGYPSSAQYRISRPGNNGAAAVVPMVAATAVAAVAAVAMAL